MGLERALESAVAAGVNAVLEADTLTGNTGLKKAFGEEGSKLVGASDPDKDQLSASEALIKEAGFEKAKAVIIKRTITTQLSKELKELKNPQDVSEGLAALQKCLGALDANLGGLDKLIDQHLATCNTVQNIKDGGTPELIGQCGAAAKSILVSFSIPVVGPAVAPVVALVTALVAFQVEKHYDEKQLQERDVLHSATGTAQQETTRLGAIYLGVKASLTESGQFKEWLTTSAEVLQSAPDSKRTQKVMADLNLFEFYKQNIQDTDVQKHMLINLAEIQREIADQKVEAAKPLLPRKAEDPSIPGEVVIAGKHRFNIHENYIKMLQTQQNLIKAELTKAGVEFKQGPEPPQIAQSTGIIGKHLVEQQTIKQELKGEIDRLTLQFMIVQYKIENSKLIDKIKGKLSKEPGLEDEKKELAAKINQLAERSIETKIDPEQAQRNFAQNKNKQAAMSQPSSPPRSAYDSDEKKLERVNELPPPVTPVPKKKQVRRAPILTGSIASGSSASESENKELIEKIRKKRGSTKYNNDIGKLFLSTVIVNYTQDASKPIKYAWDQALQTIQEQGHDMDSLFKDKTIQSLNKKVNEQVLPKRPSPGPK